MLSLVVPGLGQAYLGAVLGAAFFAATAVFLVLSMLQAWQQWRRSWFFLVVAAVVVVLYLTNAALASRLAARRAERMERHHALWRYLDSWTAAGGLNRSASEIALFVLFIVAVIGVLADWRAGRAVAGMLAYWPVFELIGAFSVGYYAGFVEHLQMHRAGPYTARQVLIGLVVFQVAAAVALHIVFRVPVLTVVLACAMTLPGQVRSLSALGAGLETAKLRAGATLLSFIWSFFLAFMIASVLERPGIPKGDLGAFASMLMGAFYMAFRVVLDTVAHDMQRARPAQ